MKKLMRPRKTGSRLFPIALCALITLLVVKLSFTVAGALHSGTGTAIAVPEAIAKDEKPKPDVGAVSVDSAKNRQGSSTGESLSALQQRENEIRKKEEQLKEKEEQLSKLEKEVEQKVNGLLAIQKQILASQNEKQDVQNAKVRGLAKIYGTMKPKEAAKLMENLDDKLVMSIISTMTPDQAASILALMEIKKAAKISEALSGR